MSNQQTHMTAFRHSQGDLLKLKTEHRFPSSHFLSGMVVGATWARLGISETPDRLWLSGIFPEDPSLAFTDSVKTYTLRNNVLLPEVRGDCFKMRTWVVTKCVAVMV